MLLALRLLHCICLLVLKSLHFQSHQDSHIIEIPSIPKAIEKKYDVTKIIGDGNFAVVLECVDKYVFKISVIFSNLNNISVCCLYILCSYFLYRATNIPYALKVIDKHKIKVISFYNLFPMQY